MGGFAISGWGGRGEEGQEGMGEPGVWAQWIIGYFRSPDQGEESTQGSHPFPSLSISPSASATGSGMGWGSRPREQQEVAETMETREDFQASSGGWNAGNKHHCGGPGLKSQLCVHLLGAPGLESKPSYFCSSKSELCLGAGTGKGAVTSSCHPPDPWAQRTVPTGPARRPSPTPTATGLGSHVQPNRTASTSWPKAGCDFSNATYSLPKPCLLCL